ncbi:MAG: phospho-N-acetylmuramoyl-pentapeptide-transferase [Clostridiales bacterium]|nr:phospho-N-acetylmuramoyl-pentapeptide-transferase [Clostridiales bacterium]
MTSILAKGFFVSFAVSVAAAFIIIPLLRRLKIGQSIKRNGPIWHLSKEGTPTMGGLIFICGMTAAVFTVGLNAIKDGRYAHLAILVFSLIYGIIGFLDDYQKVKKKGNTGLTSIQKFMLQLVVAVAFVLMLRKLGYLTPNLYVPFLQVTVPIPEPVYFVFAAFVIVGTVNAVNITDGVDGLVTGVSIPIALCFTAAAFSWGMAVQGIYAAALTGGLAAFLIFNFNPAKVIMGDTGSLFLGGSICALAFSLDMPLVLIPLAMVFIIETLSDVIQILYFKLSHGKRVFKMAPIHHHFEKSGWSEKKVFTVFTITSIVFSVIAWIGIMDRYNL